MVKNPVRINSYYSVSKVLILLAGVFLIACNSNKKPSSETKKGDGIITTSSSDDFFQELIEFSGIDFTHTIGDDHLSNLVESVGGGAVFLDYDQDGHLDIYVSNGNYTEGLSLNEDHEPNTKIPKPAFQESAEWNF